jgi:hypothetical protein
MQNDTRRTDTSADIRNVTGLRLIEHPGGQLVKHVVLAHLEPSDVPGAVQAFEYLRQERERTVPRALDPVTGKWHAPSTIELVDALTGDVLAAGHGPIELDLDDSGMRTVPPRRVVDNPKCEACVTENHFYAWHAWLSDCNLDSIESVTGKQLGKQRCGCGCAGAFYTIRVGSPKK